MAQRIVHGALSQEAGGACSQGTDGQVGLLLSKEQVRQEEGAEQREGRRERGE